ncbi:MAG: GLPGLI family protein, partial [Flavitalea sp.]
MKKIITFIILLVCSLQTFSQKFISSGKIEFERKVNLHKLYDYEGDWGDYIRKNAPQYFTSYFNYAFRGDQSLYKPGRDENDEKSRNWGD